MIAIAEAATKTAIPNFVPRDVLYYTDDTGDVFIGTGSSEPPNVLLIQAGGSATPGGTNGEIQFNQLGSLAGSGLLTDATGDLTVPGFISLKGILFDSTGSPGTVGQVLESTVTGTLWTTSTSSGGGGFTYVVTSKASTYVAVSGDDVWATGTFTITLPVLATTQRVKITNRGTGQITVVPTSGLIDGNGSLTIARQYSACEFSGDGVNIGVE